MNRVCAETVSLIVGNHLTGADLGLLAGGGGGFSVSRSHIVLLANRGEGGSQLQQTIVNGIYLFNS